MDVQNDEKRHKEKRIVKDGAEEVKIKKKKTVY